MSSKLLRLHKTLGFRLTFWYSGLFVFCSILFFSLAYTYLSISLRERDRKVITEKIHFLRMVYWQNGISSLNAEINSEIRFGRALQFFIRVADRNNRTLALAMPFQWDEFNIDDFEKNIVYPFEEWFYFPLGKTRLELISTDLQPGGLLLQVGVTLQNRDLALNSFLQTFSWIMVPIIVTAFLAGIFMASRTLRPLRSILSAIANVEKGYMDAKVNYSHTGDELEELAIRFNSMIIRINFLIKGMKNTLDNVAHDLRTPITRLRGVAEIALADKNNTEGLRLTLESCIEEMDGLAKMLTIMMDISEAETKAVKIHTQDVNLNKILSELYEFYSYSSEDKSIDFINRLPDTNIIVETDQTLLKQILGNLLDNAIKYTPNGGTISLEIRSSGNNYIEIIITDNGLGISEVELPRIWERLYRGDESRSEKGLGLGLSLAKAFTEALGGTLSAKSTYGKGSTFILSLPVVNDTVEF